jgi:hypothetical protein
MGELYSVGALFEGDLLDMRGDLGGGVYRRRNHGGQNGCDPYVHVDLPE